MQHTTSDIDKMFLNNPRETNCNMHWPSKEIPVSGSSCSGMQVMTDQSPEQISQCAKLMIVQFRQQDEAD